MEKRKLGNSDMEITIVGLGTWAIGGTGYNYSWGHQEDRDSIATIQAAVDAGINWIDTAPAYGLGHSEEVVGRAIKGMSRKPFVFTKLGKSWDAKGVLGDGLSGKTVRKETEDSLRRLNLEQIDLMQIHWPRPDSEVESAWSEMAKLVDEGKIRAIGVSNFNVAQLERICKIRVPASLQPPYAMLRRDAEAEILPWCRQHGVGVICYSPMYYGLLAEKFDSVRIQKMDADDWRRKLPELNNPLHFAYEKFFTALENVARHQGMLPGQCAIAWVLANPAVTGAIVGARKQRQILEILNSNFVLDARAKRSLDDAIAEFEKSRTTGRE